VAPGAGRDSASVLFYFPWFDPDRNGRDVLEETGVYGYSFTQNLWGAPIIIDKKTATDGAGAKYLDDLGFPRTDLRAADAITNHWHYIMRIPHSALGGGHFQPDYHFVVATRPGRSTS
jgi:hypothetical protein